jgi:hypothetical protein
MCRYLGLRPRGVPVPMLLSLAAPPTGSAVYARGGLHVIGPTRRQRTVREELHVQLSIGTSEGKARVVNVPKKSGTSRCNRGFIAVL